MHDSHTNVLHFFGATKWLNLDFQILSTIELEDDAERTVTLCITFLLGISKLCILFALLLSLI